MRQSTSPCASVSSTRATRVPNPEYAPIHPDAFGQYFAQALQVELPTRGLDSSFVRITLLCEAVLL